MFNYLNYYNQMLYCYGQMFLQSKTDSSSPFQPNLLQSQILPRSTQTNIPTFQPILLPKQKNSTVSSLDQIDIKAKVPKKSKKKEITKKKDENFGWRNQNKDRNLISNILKGFIQSVVQEPKISERIQKLIEIHHFNFTVSDYKLFLESNFSNKKSYIGVKYIKDVITDEGNSAQLLLIFKHNLFTYLKETYPLIVISSPKIKKRCKVSQLKKVRKMVESFFEI